MIEQSQGLVLRTRPLTDTSLIVHWLTPELGRIATVAKGARRTNSPFHGKLDLFYLADFSFQRSRRSDLHTLREVALRGTHNVLRENLACLQQASYCAALIEQTTETDTPLPALFELMSGLLNHLPRQSAQPLAILVFEMRLLRELGQAPDPVDTRLSEGAKKILARLIGSDWSALRPLKLSAAQFSEIKQFLHGFLIWHLGKIPPGREAALTA